MHIKYVVLFMVSFHGVISFIYVIPGWRGTHLLILLFLGLQWRGRSLLPSVGAAPGARLLLARAGLTLHFVHNGALLAIVLYHRHCLARLAAAPAAAISGRRGLAVASRPALVAAAVAAVAIVVPGPGPGARLGAGTSGPGSRVMAVSGAAVTPSTRA